MTSSPRGRANGELVDYHTRIALLRASPYFAAAPAEIIERIAKASSARRYDAGQRIFIEGEAEGSAALHFVVEGTIRIYKVSGEGREQVLRLMRPGDSFADVAAFDGGAYPANADALEPAILLIVPRDVLWAAMTEHPEIALGAVSIMAARLRHMTGLVEDLSLRRVTSRVAKYLLTDDRRPMLNQSQLAAVLGTSREMVNRSLHQLADSGAIDIDGSRITIRDRAKLEEQVANA